MKLKCPNPLKPLGTIIQQNYKSSYPSEPFSFVHFNMIYPVSNYIILPRKLSKNHKSELSPETFLLQEEKLRHLLLKNEYFLPSRNSIIVQHLVPWWRRSWAADSNREEWQLFVTSEINLPWNISMIYTSFPFHNSDLILRISFRK